MVFKFVPILLLVAIANAATLDYSQVNRQLQMQQRQQQQLNFDMQRQQNQYQEMMNQRHWEDNNRHHMNAQMQVQEYQEMQQLHFDNPMNTQNHRIHLYPAATSHQHFSQNHYHGQPEANYQFAYAVNDQFTGDHKTHTETRQGDRVEGQYSMVDPDGYKRVVEYRADDTNGFQSEVHRTPINTMTRSHIGHHNGAESYQYFNQGNSNNAMDNFAVMTY